MVTNGSMEAAALLFRYMIEPGDRVLVEQPSYDRTLLLLGPHRRRAGPGARSRPTGSSSRRFEAALAGGPVKLAHVIPNFHNPAGCTLSAAKRERLVELAAEHDFWIFEDDPYRLIKFGDAELPPTMLSTGHARAGSSTPRRSPRRSARACGSAISPARPSRSRRSPSAAPSTTSRRTCSPSRSCSSSAAPAPSPRNIEVVNGALAERRDALVAALREQIPEAEFVVPGGGYFLWLDLDPGVDTPALLAAAQEEGVAFVAGPDFMLEGGESSLRLSFASVPADRVAEGVARSRGPWRQRRDRRPA